jgi:hypothetical protein
MKYAAKTLIRFITKFVDFDLQVRTKINPTKWPIIEPGKQFLNSGLHHRVGLIVPGQRSSSIHHFAQPPNIPYHQIPPPPLPADFHLFPPPSAPQLTDDLTDLHNGVDFHHVGENLNPDVPEFIPVTVRIRGENGDRNLAETERSESEEQCEDLEINHEGI